MLLNFDLPVTSLYTAGLEQSDFNLLVRSCICIVIQIQKDELEMRTPVTAMDGPNLIAI
jgi:hypothetical protein